MPKPKMTELAEPSKPEVVQAPLTWIDIPEDRARHFDPEEAVALSAIIATTGLQHPIRVRAVGNRYRLIAGRKRLEAVRLLGWNSIPLTISLASSDDDARLEEVMENLGRIELNKLDRCQHLFELKQVYERLYPEAKHGGDRKSEIKTQKLRFDPASEEVLGFSAVTAEKIGMSRRSIELAVKIWMDLSDASRGRCAGTWLADHQAGLKQLAEQSHGDQAKVLDILFAQTPKATNVPDALAIIANGRVLTHTERKVAAVTKTLKSLPGANDIVAAQVDARLAELQKSIATMSKFIAGLKDDELDDVIIEHEDRIIASLQRRGRI
ncbi:ParB/RepB/Spo0J family partition protein [Rhizobium nepotum]|uniref:ParB domain-containing protein nuclease n=1 Tax=Rhizobium nepotum 39/7 TaxID=1368418 RepID=A0ABR5CRD7_9HYPH|nr:ParB/RepB/Spo0J family partition protein [Rhizobium nepotum]KJF67425.1 ParB domain-containing protein nuclease [Rhizobium nepotum 39/7]